MPQILLYSFFRIWNPCPLHLNLGNLCNLFGQQNTEKVNCANFWVQTLKYWYYPLFVSWKILPWNSKLSCKNSNYLAKLLCGKFIMSMRRVRKRGCHCWKSLGFAKRVPRWATTLPGSAAISSTEFGRRVFSFLLGQLSSDGRRQHQSSKILHACLGLASVPWLTVGCR